MAVALTLVEVYSNVKEGLTKRKVNEYGRSRKFLWMRSFIRYRFF